MTRILHTWSTSVRFQDVDAYGLVSVPTLLGHVHDAYADWLATIGMPLPELLAGGDVILPLVHAETDMQSPLRFGDAIRVVLEVASTKERSFALTHRVLRNDAVGSLVARGATHHVSVSTATRKACALPPRLRAALAGPGGDPCS
ncbi:MAG: thioesterase family protein [Polyangiaceae bacterium]